MQLNRYGNNLSRIFWIGWIYECMKLDIDVAPFLGPTADSMLAQTLRGRLLSTAT